MAEERPNRLTRGQALAAVGTGLAGAAIVWIATPYSNAVIGNPPISDNYLPTSALFLALLLILGINPLLIRLRPRWAFNSPQLALILGILLMACVPIGTGFLKMVPYGIANAPTRIAQERQIAELFPAEDIPPSLYPDKLGYGEETPVARGFLLELSGGDPIPWKAWWPPLLAWGTFAFFWWALLAGLAMIVTPQWRRNERLPFPLLTLHHSMIEPPREGQCLPPLFRGRGFWIAVGAVFFLHLLAGIKKYDPTLVPAVPLSWSMGDFFANVPYRYLPEYIKSGRVYFVFLGVAYFMSNRVGFSIWFFAIAYAVYTMIGQAYMQPFNARVIVDHRTGAMLAFATWVLWLGRGHWRQVALATIRRPADDEGHRDRFAGWLFAVGGLGVFGWLVWSGAQPQWAFLYVLIALLYALIVTRIVAETGLVLVGIGGNHMHDLMRLFPTQWFNAASVYVGGILSAIAGIGSRLNLTAMGVHSFSLDEEASPRQMPRLAVGFLLLLTAGLVIGGAVHLNANYRHGTTLDGLEQPLNYAGVQSFDGAFTLLKQHGNETWDRPAYNQPAAIGFGALLAAALQWACLVMPRFPFHPVGLLIVYTWYMEQLWASVFLGWLAKLLVVRYGGARLYSSARGVFLGLIVGEVAAAVFWAAVPVLMVQTGRPYVLVQVLPF